LEDVDRISDRVILMSSGFIVAEGRIQDVRKEVQDQPIQILVRCSDAKRLAAEAFSLQHVVGATVQNDGGGVLVRTTDTEEFFRLLNRIVATGVVQIEAVTPADEDVNSIYHYLIGSDGNLA
jgi:ABC-2 type transport system ATP-binding protein